MPKQIWGKVVVVKFMGPTNTKSSRLKVSSRYGDMTFNWDYSRGDNSEDQLKGKILGIKKIGAYGDLDIFTTSEKWNGEVKNG